MKLHYANIPYHTNVFVTGDQHFGHKNIIRYGSRPYNSVEEMDNALIGAWNNIVTKNDIVLHLGDFSFGKPQLYLERLNYKQIYLVVGNHDKKLKHFDFVCDKLDIVLGKIIIVCSHYPFESWDRSHHGSYHLHAHCHGKARNIPQRLDVGVDNVGPEPLEFFNAISYLKDSNNL